jgi:hypothetical protein
MPRWSGGPHDRCEELCNSRVLVTVATLVLLEVQVAVAVTFLQLPAKSAEAALWLTCAILAILAKIAKCQKMYLRVTPRTISEAYSTMLLHWDEWTSESTGDSSPWCYPRERSPPLWPQVLWAQATASGVKST